MIRINLSLDPGGSQTKVVYELPKDEKPRYLLISPEVEEVKQESLQRYLSKQHSFANPPAIKQIYLSVEDRFYVLGEFANEFYPEDRINEVKYEKALYKVLSAIGMILEENKVTPSKVRLHLSILLPWNEYEDRKRFKDKIEQYLKNFSFRGKTYSITLKKFICRPEGGGLIALHDAADKSWQRGKKVGFLMLGHRNISALIFDDGQLDGSSPLIGLSQLYNDVIERTSGLDKNKIAEAINTAIDGCWNNRTRYIHAEHPYRTYPSENKALNTNMPKWSFSRAIGKLANAKDSDLKSQEIEQISSAIEIAETDYWEGVEKFLKQIFPKDLDTVIISGGGSKILRKRLEIHYNNAYSFYKDTVKMKRDGKLEPTECFVRIVGGLEVKDKTRHFTKIVWSNECLADIDKVFSFKKADLTKSLPERLVDAYGLFTVLRGKK